MYESFLSAFQFGTYGSSAVSQNKITLRQHQLRPERKCGFRVSPVIPKLNSTETIYERLYYHSEKIISDMSK